MKERNCSRAVVSMPERIVIAASCRARVALSLLRSIDRRWGCDGQLTACARVYTPSAPSFSTASSSFLFILRTNADFDLEIGSLDQHILETGSLIVYRSRSPVDVAYVVRKARSTGVRAVSPSLLSWMIRVRLGSKVLFLTPSLRGVIGAPVC